MMAYFGLALLALVGGGLSLTGLPAFMVVLAVAVFGAGASVAAGWVGLDILAALPNRVVNLLESDLLQALPLYVLMGALLNRLPVASALFHTAVYAAPRSRASPVIAGIGLGVVLGPMNGSVGASVQALSRSLAPELAARGLPAPFANAIIVVASTLGVVVPPSLVLILLGDTMMAAHTVALNATGHAARIINTRDVFRGALPPAFLFVALSVCVSVFMARRLPDMASAPATKPLRPGDILLSAAILIFVAGLLMGVAFGVLYAVEGAALGAVVLFAAAAFMGQLAGGSLSKLLSDVIAWTGALFALLVAATTLTLLLRILGSDKLVTEIVRALPGGEGVPTAAVLGLIGVSAIVLDAFEIIFVVVPILAPPLLERVGDAVWVAVLILLVLQMSFMAPPFGYALMLVQATARNRSPFLSVLRALAPYLAAQIAVLVLVFVWPGLVHIADPAPPAALQQRLNDEDLPERLKRLAPPPEDDLPPPVIVR
jgi:tripartite ATP-independent transporter DctM subunit